MQDNITAKHKDLSKSSPHLGSTLSYPDKGRNLNKQIDKHQRICDKVVDDKKVKDKDDTESGIDIPEPDYSPILIRRNMGVEEFIDYEYRDQSPPQKNTNIHKGETNDEIKGLNSNSSTTWESAARYHGIDDQGLVEDGDSSELQQTGKRFNYKMSVAYDPTIVNKPLPHGVKHAHAKDKTDSNQALSVNYNSIPIRSEEEAILGLEKALVGRTKVKDMVEKIRKETERDKIKQELRRSAFLVSQCQTTEDNATDLNTSPTTRKNSCSGSSDGVCGDGNENQFKKEDDEINDLVIEDLEIYGNPVDDDEDIEEEGIDIYKDLISVALEQEKLEDLRQLRAKSNGREQRDQEKRNKRIEDASLYGNYQNDVSEVPLKASQSRPSSSKVKRRTKRENSDSNGGRMNAYDQNRSRPNSTNFRRSVDSLSPERSILSSSATNGNFSLSYSQDFLDEKKEMRPQSIMRSQPNINMFNSSEISSFPNGSRNFPEGK